MTHLWIRAESRPNELRTGVTPEGVAGLAAAGFRVTVEDSGTRVLPTASYRAAGAEIAPEGSWPVAPADAIVIGLKELPEDGTPLRHRHVMFGHAFKGQPTGRDLLRRFRAGGGALYDLEYLTDGTGRRLAAFGRWAGFAGAAVALHGWQSQMRGALAGPIDAYPSSDALVETLSAAMPGGPPPDVIVIGAKGRVGGGAADFCARAGLPMTEWDLDETAQGGPFPEILEHVIFLNCILAQPGTPVFVPEDAATAPRRLRVIGDIACDPTSDFSPVRVYDRTTTWEAPALRVHDDPPLDVTAIDNLPSMLPRESSEDFAAQLLPVLATIDRIDAGPWGRARALFDDHLARLERHGT